MTDARVPFRRCWCSGRAMIFHRQGRRVDEQPQEAQVVHPFGKTPMNSNRGRLACLSASFARLGRGRVDEHGSVAAVCARWLAAGAEAVPTN
ncbi:MAG: hypothetical protein H5T86_02180 [Armatimonadetes bacterium]|nr:hypothetical protein [Armatimonadota bacterium]